MAIPRNEIRVIPGGSGTPAERIAMITHRLAAALIASVALSSGMPLMAQTVVQTKVHTGTEMKDGVATTKTTVTHTRKRKTHHPRKILGLKVGTKTDVDKTVKTTTDSSNGDSSTTVTTSH